MRLTKFKVGDSIQIDNDTVDICDFSSNLGTIKQIEWSMITKEFHFSIVDINGRNRWVTEDHVSFQIPIII